MRCSVARSVLEWTRMRRLSNMLIFSVYTNPSADEDVGEEEDEEGEETEDKGEGPDVAEVVRRLLRRWMVV